MLNKLKNIIAATGTFAPIAFLLCFNMPGNGNNSMKKPSLYKIGRRGTRGFMPENTLHPNYFTNLLK